MAGKASVVTDDTVNLAVNGLARCMPKHKIRQAIEKYLGHGISPKSTERILARARDYMRQRARVTVDEAAEDCLASIESLIADPKTPVAERRKLIELKMDLTGCSAKYRSGYSAAKLPTVIGIDPNDRDPDGKDSGSD